MKKRYFCRGQQFPQQLVSEKSCKIINRGRVYTNNMVKRKCRPRNRGDGATLKGTIISKRYICIRREVNPPQLSSIAGLLSARCCQKSNMYTQQMSSSLRRGHPYAGYWQPGSALTGAKMSFKIFQTSRDARASVTENPFTIVFSRVP